MTYLVLIRHFLRRENRVEGAEKKGKQKENKTGIGFSFAVG